MAPDASHGPARNAALTDQERRRRVRLERRSERPRFVRERLPRGLGRQDGTARPSRLNARGIGGHDHLRRREDARRPAGW